MKPTEECKEMPTMKPTEECKDMPSKAPTQPATAPPVCFQVNITLGACPHSDLDKSAQDALCHIVSDTCGVPASNVHYHGCEPVGKSHRRLAEMERSLRGISLPIHLPTLPTLYELETCTDICGADQAQAAAFYALVKAKLDVAISSSHFDNDMHSCGSDDLKNCHTTHHECGNPGENNGAAPHNMVTEEGKKPIRNKHPRRPGHPGVMSTISSMWHTH